MMTNLAEELLLLALHDQKGTVVWSTSESLPYGLAGAVLLELTFRSGEERKVARKRVKEIGEGELVGKAISDTVAGIQASITAAIVASVAVSSAASSSSSPGC